MTTTEPFRPSQVGEQASDDELRDALIREARQRARRRRSMYVGAVVVTAVAAIAAWSTASSGNPPPPAALDDLLQPAEAGPKTSAAASPTTTSAPLPTQFRASSSLVDVSTGERSPVPAGLAEGFSRSDTYVSGYAPSPDGTRVIAFIECASPLTSCAGGGQMAVGNIDGSDVRTITPPDFRRVREARWSPDGTKIVFSATGTVGEVFIEDVTTGEQTQVTHLELANSDAFYLSPTFTPDGKTVLFALPGDLSRAPGVWSVPVTGGEPTLVPTLPVLAAFPAPLPDGKTIAYVCGMVGICVRRIDDPGSFRVLNESVGVVFDLAVSPDGTRLLYRYGDPFEARGGIGVVFVGTGPPKFAAAVTSASWLGQPGGSHAAWLDNETLIVTEVTPV